MIEVAATPSASVEETVDYAKMLDEVLAREKVIKTEWLDKTKDIYEIYEGGKSDETPFNILYSNTEILVPNLFSSAPKPIIRRRFGESRADDASRAAERMAEYSMDTNLAGYPDFVEALESVVLDAALPGQGQARVRLVNEVAVIDYVQHDQFIWAYAKRWEDTGWIAYRHDKTIADAVKEFDLPDEIKAKLVITESPTGELKDKAPATIAIYEVWNKTTRQVCFLTASYDERCLKELPDPLGLENFYPSGKPLRLLSTPISTMPKALYGLYRRQAKELNYVTQRIEKLTQAIKVRGIYDGTISELAQVFDSGDMENSLVPTNSPGALSRDNGIDKHIWLIPVDKYIVVLQQLYQVREQIKSTIYEILGIGDILRGVSAASETAAAQTIKDKWGTLRIKKSREKVSTFVRTQIRLLIEVSAKHVPEETWGKVTGLPFIGAVEAMMLQQNPPIPQPGMPPVPPPVAWSSVLGDLRDDLTRSYRIDIETNSTVDGDATTEKEEVSEFMTAFAQAMQGLAPLGASSPEGFKIANEILKEIFKRYRMGAELVKLIDTLKPQPKGPTPEVQKLQEEAEKRLEEAKKAEEGVKSSEEGLKAQFEQQKAQLDQITQQIEGMKRDLQNESMRLDQQAAELDQTKESLKLEAAMNDLKVQKAQLGLEKQAMQATEKVTGIVRQAQDAHQKETEQATKEAPAKPSEDAGMKALVSAMADQSKAFGELVKILAKPVTITKTGPGTFTRS